MDYKVWIDLETGTWGSCKNLRLLDEQETAEFERWLDYRGGLEATDSEMRAYANNSDSLETVLYNTEQFAVRRALDDAMTATLEALES